MVVHVSFTCGMIICTGCLLARHHPDMQMPANIMIFGNGLAAVRTTHLATTKVLVAAAPDSSGGNATRVEYHNRLEEKRRRKAAL